MRVELQQVHEFLESVFVVRIAGTASQGHGNGAPAGPLGPLPALQLHPRVEAEFPGGVHASSAEEVQAALAVYRALLAGVVSFDVFDVVVSGDTALVVGEQVVRSRIQDAAAAAGRALPHWAVEAAAATLPSVQRGHVPTAVSLTLGKNDAGDPVVTKLAVTFSLPAALSPHVRLPPWQQAAAKACGDALLWALQGAGGAAAVAEDAWTAAAAAWRASGAIGGTALDSAETPALALLRAAAGAAAQVVWARMGLGAQEEGEGEHEPAAQGHSQHAVAAA